MKCQLDDAQQYYIHVIVTGIVEQTGMLNAISELIHHPNYHCKHSLWDFSNASAGLNIKDLRKIVRILHLFKPRSKNFANKVALVIPGHMHQAMANIFVSIATLLPFKYKVFKSNEAALKFLIPPGN
ncbi:MAG: hypothetical protein GY710_25275 [Desulfobacteraceae bacterium]|nr:hypothetical protein [Desulfobacteraceae bacterium]